MSVFWDPLLGISFFCHLKAFRPSGRYENQAKVRKRLPKLRVQGLWEICNPSISE